MKDLRGVELAGYRLTEPLGRGGFATVWAAEGPEPAVVKLGRERGGRPGATAVIALADASALHGERAESVGPTSVDALLQEEAEVLGRAKGAAGLPRLLAAAEHEGRPALVLERIDGPTLVEAQRAGEPLALAAVADLARALADAIGAGALPAHGDLKLANLIRTSEGRLRPIDPGCAANGVVATTPGYQPLLRLDPDGDRVALCSCLYAYPSGRVPFPVLAPGRVLAGDKTAWRAFLALHLAPLDAPEPLARLVTAQLEAALEPRGIDGLRQLAEELEQLSGAGCAELPAPALTQPARPPG